MIYEEVKDDIGYFVKLYRLGKAKGMSIQQVVDVLAMANNDLPAIEERVKRIRKDISIRQFRKHICERSLYQLNNQIVSTTNLLNSLRMSCKRERREIANLYNEKARLEAIITGFKNNNGEYLKIKQAAEEKIKDVLTKSKLLLKFATLSVIESLRRIPELYNFVLNDISTASHGSSSLLLTARQQQSFTFISDNDIYTALILREAEKIYNKLTTKLTNEVMIAAAAIKASSSSLPLPITNNRQNDTYKIEEPRYNNQS
jgi:hypothetical protein